MTAAKSEISQRNKTQVAPTQDCAPSIRQAPSQWRTPLGLGSDFGTKTEVEAELAFAVNARSGGSEVEQQLRA